MRGVWEWVSQPESGIEMWGPLMPRLIVFSNLKGEIELNRPLEKLGNNTRPMRFDGIANIKG